MQALLALPSQPLFCPTWSPLHAHIWMREVFQNAGDSARAEGKTSDITSSRARIPLPSLESAISSTKLAFENINADSP